MHVLAPIVGCREDIANSADLKWYRDFLTDAEWEIWDTIPVDCDLSTKLRQKVLSGMDSADTRYLLPISLVLPNLDRLKKCSIMQVPHWFARLSGAELADTYKQYDFSLLKAEMRFSVVLSGSFGNGIELENLVLPKPLLDVVSGMIPFYFDLERNALLAEDV